MIHTSYFAKEQHIKNAGMVPIAITAKVPDWYEGLVYDKLAPTIDILMEYKRTGDRDRYIERYKAEVLDKLDPYRVWWELKEITGIHYAEDKQGICLMCYEKPDSFCHRHLVAEWLTENRIECQETYIGG